MDFVIQRPSPLSAEYNPPLAKHTPSRQKITFLRPLSRFRTRPRSEELTHPHAFPITHCGHALLLYQSYAFPNESNMHMQHCTLDTGTRDECVKSDTSNTSADADRKIERHYSRSKIGFAPQAPNLSFAICLNISMVAFSFA